MLPRIAGTVGLGSGSVDDTNTLFGLVRNEYSGPFYATVKSPYGFIRMTANICHPELTTSRILGFDNYRVDKNIYTGNLVKPISIQVKYFIKY